MQCFEAGKLLFLFTNKKGKERRMYFKKNVLQSGIKIVNAKEK